MIELSIAVSAGIRLAVVLMGLACAVLLLWSVDRRGRTRFSAERRGQGRHGYKRF